MEPLFDDQIYQFKTKQEEKLTQQEENVEKKTELIQEEQVQDKAMKFSEMTEMYSHIGDKEAYTFKDGKSLKVAQRETRKNSSMSQVIDALKTLTTKLNEGLSPEDLTNEEKIKEAHATFLEVCKACRTYLKRHKKKPWTSEGKARRQMVVDILDQTEKESIAFYEQIKSFKENGVPEGTKIESWKDVVEQIRTEVIDTKSKDVKITRGGAGTSFIKIIETKDKNGQKVKRFFKENEKVEEADYKGLIKLQIEKITASEKGAKISDEEKAENNEMKRILDIIMKSVGKMSDEEKDSSFLPDDAERVLERLKMEMSDAAANEVSALEKNPKLYNRLKETIWAVRQNYTLSVAANKGAKIKKGNSVTKRNAATSRLADILGVGDLVVKSHMAKIIIDGKTEYGVIMDEAHGDEMFEVQKMAVNSGKKEITYSNDAYRRLMNLQIFDTLCAQVDRHEGNYKVEGEKTRAGFKVTKFAGIDNDLCFGNLRFKDIAKKGKESYFNMKKITDTNGNFALRTVDEEFAGRILALEEEQLRFQMLDLLDDEELDALVDRIKGVKNLLRKAIQSKKTKLISKDDDAAWTKAQKDLVNKIDGGDQQAYADTVSFTYISPLAFKIGQKMNKHID